MNLAIIVGISGYENLKPLNACKNDTDAISHILKTLNKFDDVCLISTSPKASEIKKKIADFVNTHKSGKPIKEVVFYYTGHGARYDDDFYYTGSDFKEARKETTGFRNSELDGLIRNLNPELTVKIIDSCFSGTPYVKSDENDIKPLFEKSASENKLNKIYFLHSSNSEQESLASDKFSFFTLSFCRSLIQRAGTIRYRDIMSYVADDMAERDYPKPAFVVQADNTETFGDITEDLISYIKSKFEIKDPSDSTSKDELTASENNDELQRIVENKSHEEYCNEKEAIDNIQLLYDSLSKGKWSQELHNYFEIEESKITSSIQNEIFIGRWLLKKESDGYFAKPYYEEEIFYTEEYKEVPKKPLGRGAGILSSAIILEALGSRYNNNTDYKLEKVEKTRELLSGVEYTTEPPFKALRISFKPKFNALDNYSLIVAIIFSRKILATFSSRECLQYIDWDRISSPLCKDWKIAQMNLKKRDGIEKYCSEMVTSMSEYILEDIKTKLLN